MEINDYLYEVEYYGEKAYYFRYIVSKIYSKEMLILPDSEFSKTAISLKTSCIVDINTLISNDLNNHRIFLSEKDFKKLNIDFSYNNTIHFLLNIQSIKEYEKVIDYIHNKNKFLLENYKINGFFGFMNAMDRNPELKYIIDNLRARKETLLTYLNNFKFHITKKDLERKTEFEEKDIKLLNLLEEYKNK